MLRERGLEAGATPGGKGQFDVISNGELVIGSGAGISVEIDEDKLTRYRLDR